MRVIVFGSGGFIGRAVCEALNPMHEVIRAGRSAGANGADVGVDLLDGSSIGAVLGKFKPDIVINCAGIVDSSKNVNDNITFTKNILEQSIRMPSIKRVVISGSAGEYGLVNERDIPVNEGVRLNANSGYGLAKVGEERFALEFGREHGLDVVVLRVFNPIGVGMGEKFLISRILGQIDEYAGGYRDQIELSRLDASRDYISVVDVANAYKVIVEGEPMYDVYNVGSGISTSNGQLVETILKHSKLDTRPHVVETSSEAEPLVASQADISRLTNEFSWSPVYNVDETIREIMNEKIAK